MYTTCNKRYKSHNASDSMFAIVELFTTEIGIVNIAIAIDCSYLGYANRVVCTNLSL